MISIHLDHIGRDHLLRVTGGTKPHIGAAVVASYNKNEVTVESIGLPHHKEERLFVELAKTWCSKFHQTTVVTGGIHIDNATKEQIDFLVKQTWKELHDLIEKTMEKTP